MRNTDTDFYGRQTDERILYAVRPHAVARIIAYIKVILAVFAVWFGFWAIDNQLTFIKADFGFIGGLLALIVGLIGGLTVRSIYSKKVAYITDRRVVKFEAPTPFATRIRSLSWDQVVKAKTFPPNFLWKMFMIGTLVVHAKSTVASPDTVKSENVTTDDDVEVEDVYYYRDVANYIEKILFTYRRTPKELVNLKPFVAKPKGQRG